jgi:hypothetical protein
MPTGFQCHTLEEGDMQRMLVSWLLFAMIIIVCYGIGRAADCTKDCRNFNCVLDTDGDTYVFYDDNNGTNRVTTCLVMNALLITWSPTPDRGECHLVIPEVMIRRYYAINGTDQCPDSGFPREFCCCDKNPNKPFVRKYQWQCKKDEY